MRPVVSALKRSYGEQVEIIIVDVRSSEGLALAQQYRVTATPTYIFLTGDGFVTGTLQGRQDLKTMEEALDQLLTSQLDSQEQLEAAFAQEEKVVLSFVLPG